MNTQLPLLLPPTLIYQPYAYIIKHKSTGTWYYGIQYSQNKYHPANPYNLWVSYFSSSKIIHQMIIDYGLESFDVQVRRLFTNQLQAESWEQKFLQRSWSIPGRLNGNCAGILTNKGRLRITDGVNEKMIFKHEKIPIGWKLGRCITGKIRVNNTKEVIMVYPDCVPENYTKGGLIKSKSWITNSIIERWVDTNDSIPQGWKLGRCTSTTLNRILVNDGKCNYLIPKEDFNTDKYQLGSYYVRSVRPSFTHKKLKCKYCTLLVDAGNFKQFHGDNCKLNINSPRSKVGSFSIWPKITKKRTRKITKRIKCPYCDKVGSPSNMKRWHFDNCKTLKP